MRTRLSMVLSALLALASWCAFAQTSPAFEVAVIKPAVTMDMAATIAAIREGHSPKMGAQINASRAEYSHMALSDLIALAWNVKPYQITGPDWLRTQRFDITARLPDGASMDDVPRMLQTLLEERFRLALRRTSEERPVLALLVGRGGPKMKESPEPQSAAAGGDLPLKPGEVKVDMGDGPVRMAVGSGLSGTMDMSEKGAVSYKTDPVTRTMHMDGSRITMPGFADMPAQLSQMIDGDGRQIVDMTGLKGGTR